MYTLVYSIDIVLTITFIIGLFNYKKYKHTPLKYFILFLGYGIATEILGLFFYDLFGFVNHIIYNIFTFIEALFYLWLFGQFFKTKIYIKTALIFRRMLLLIFVINTLFFEDIFIAYQSYLFLPATLFLIIIIIMFFIEILNNEAILRLKRLPIFWIAVGVLLFQLGFLPVFIAKNYINNSQGLTYGYIVLLLNIISGTCFSLGFIWSRKDVEVFNKEG